MKQFTVVVVVAQVIIEVIIQAGVVVIVRH